VSAGGLGPRFSYC